MSILSGNELVSLVARGEGLRKSPMPYDPFFPEPPHINIDPFNKDQVNPVSYDLRLGNKYGVYSHYQQASGTPGGHVLDARKENKVEVKEFESLVLEPGELYLMHTAERVHTNHFVPILDGKSSIGRLGVCVHLTAGFGDPGFDGQYTLEVTCVRSVRIYAGMRFCQIRFHQVVGDVELYDKKGHYQGRDSRGPVPSMSWKQFEEDK